MKTDSYGTSVDGNYPEVVEAAQYAVMEALKRGVALVDVSSKGPVTLEEGAEFCYVVDGYETDWPRFALNLTKLHHSDIPEMVEYVANFIRRNNVQQLFIQTIGDLFAVSSVRVFLTRKAAKAAKNITGRIWIVFVDKQGIPTLVEYFPS